MNEFTEISLPSANSSKITFLDFEKLILLDKLFAISSKLFTFTTPR